MVEESPQKNSYASTSSKSGATITFLPAILPGNIILIRDEKIYMLWSIVLQKSFAKQAQAHQSYLKIQQIRSMSQWQECEYSYIEIAPTNDADTSDMNAICW